MPEENPENKQNKQPASQGITPRELMFKYLRYAPWLILSVALMLMLAYLKLRYTTPIYSVSGKLQVKNQTNYGGSDKFDDIFLMQQGNRNLNDEMEIIRSRAMAQRVINALDMQLMYYNKGKIRTSAIYAQDVPFDFEIVSLKDSSRSFSLQIFIINDTQYKTSEDGKALYFNQVMQRPEGVFRLQRNGNSYKAFASNQFIVNWQPTEDRAGSISGGLRVSQAADYSSVLLLTYVTENTKIGRDVINQYMYEYQQSSLEEKRQIAVNTLSFIDDQLVSVKQDLGAVERSLQQFKENSKAFNPEQQTQLFFGNISELSRQLTDLGVKIKVIDFLIAYVSDQKNPFRVVPTSLNIDEPSLLQTISEYNKYLLQRETYLKTTPATNPLVKNLETAIYKLKDDMIQNLRNIRQTYVVAQNELNEKNREANASIRSMPGKEKQLLEITRQQKILEELYSYLLQKKLETAISSASTISNIQVVEPALYSDNPIKPNRRSMYLLAVAIGILIPVLIVFLLEYLNDKVKTRSDVERSTDAPIIGEVGHSEESGALVVTKNNRKFIAEQFRMIRTNLQYVLPHIDKPILLVTSTFSGEGKSFISTNMGAVLAVSGRRTVILEFDIRKPKILKGLKLNEKKGITNYIVGNISVDDIIYPVPAAENLFVIPCGPVPPNPAELLLDEKIPALFEELRSRFDVVIVDSAPVGLVSDAITLGKFTDATLYIIRYNYTLKKQLQMIGDIYDKKKLPHLSLIINDVYTKGGYGSYYGYGGYYGYGYGYGYGSDYFEDGNKRRGWLSKLKFWT